MCFSPAIYLLRLGRLFVVGLRLRRLFNVRLRLGHLFVVGLRRRSVDLVICDLAVLEDLTFDLLALACVQETNQLPTLSFQLLVWIGNRLHLWGRSFGFFGRCCRSFELG